MLIESRKITEIRKAKRLNLLKGRQPRNPSQTNGGAKIQLIFEIKNLEDCLCSSSSP